MYILSGTYEQTLAESDFDISHSVCVLCSLNSQINIAITMNNPVKTECAVVKYNWNYFRNKINPYTVGILSILLIII